MSFANPTSLRVGAAGILGGRRFRVLGRIVMGMEEDGETYYWNEFNLVDDAGSSATLVFEETEDGPQWRLFTLFDPVHPMTARAAASKRVGDSVNLDGTPIQVTLVDQSRVYFIEGEAPEGVEVGDVANYFNAEDQTRMLVASWTGGEIEFYWGVDVTADTVTNAFGLPGTASTSSLTAFSGTRAETSSSGLITKLIAMVIAAVIGLAVHSSWSSRQRTEPLVKPKPPAAPLVCGATGALARRTYTVTGHSVVEVAKVSAVYDRHEYDLANDAGGQALLVCGLNGDFKQWHLFQPIAPIPGLLPFLAAAKRPGDGVNLDGNLMRIKEVFRAKFLSRDGELSPRVAPGSEQFGFLAEGNDELLMARWTNQAIEFHRGRALADKDVAAGFGRK